MALSTGARTAITATSVVLLLGAAAVGYLIFTGNSDNIPFLGGTREQAVCPLTNEEASNETLAGRPVLAAKIENSPESRPQAGLMDADIVYEEPVEGGITRFIAIYQCENSPRLGPIRSARFVDPDILVQYGDSLLAYSGGIPDVIQEVRDTGLIQDLGFDRHMDLYIEDPSRSAPHNLYSSTRTFYQAGRRAGGPPDPVFEYDEAAPERRGSRRATSVSLPFSPSSDVSWEYQRASGTYARAHSGVAHTTEDGTQVRAANVVVMSVELRDTGIIDPAGNPSPEVVAIGSGDAWIFRDGRAIEGTWTRETAGDLTVFTDRQGEEIPLKPGVTWVELFPNTLEVEYS